MNINFQSHDFLHSGTSSTDFNKDFLHNGTPPLLCTVFYQNTKQS